MDYVFPVSAFSCPWILCFLVWAVCCPWILCFYFGSILSMDSVLSGFGKLLYMILCFVCEFQLRVDIHGLEARVTVAFLTSDEQICVDVGVA